jgi:hypothetical protein
MEGGKGPIAYDWAFCPVVESRDQLPGPDVWLLARRSLSKPNELAYYLCYAIVLTWPRIWNDGQAALGIGAIDRIQSPLYPSCYPFCW